MKLTILGCGICIMKEDRTGPAYLVEAGNQLLLLDCGWGFGKNFLKAGYELRNLDHILISHPHADHMGNLMNILQSIFVSGLFFPEEQKREKPLFLHGYKGFTKDYETLRKMMFPERKEPYNIKLFEYPDNLSSFGDVTIIGCEVKHNPHFFHSCAYRISYQNKSVVYSGDTSFDEALIKLSKGADFAIYEASTPPKSYRENGPARNHLSPYQAGLIAEKAGVGSLALVHVYYDLTTVAEIEEEARKNFKGELIFPHDLQSFTI